MNLGNTLGNLNYLQLANNPTSIEPDMPAPDTKAIELMNGLNLLDMEVKSNRARVKDLSLDWSRSRTLDNEPMLGMDRGLDIPTKAKAKSKASVVFGSPSRSDGSKGKVLDEVKKKYLGKKYIWGAKVGDCRGADCSALTSYYAKGLGANIPRTAYGQFKFLKSKGRLTKDLKSVSAGDLLYFDFKNRNGNPIGHTAIVVGRDDKGIKVLEASGSIGSVVERYLPKRYYSRIAGIGKL